MGMLYIFFLLQHLQQTSGVDNNAHGIFGRISSVDCSILVAALCSSSSQGLCGSLCADHKGCAATFNNFFIAARPESCHDINMWSVWSRDTGTRCTGFLAVKQRETFKQCLVCLFMSLIHTGCSASYLSTSSITSRVRLATRSKQRLVWSQVGGVLQGDWSIAGTAAYNSLPTSICNIKKL